VGGQEHDGELLPLLACSIQAHVCWRAASPNYNVPAPRRRL
jgi:hypothetical protein